MLAKNYSHDKLRGTIEVRPFVKHMKLKFLKTKKRKLAVIISGIVIVIFVIVVAFWAISKRSNLASSNDLSRTQDQVLPSNILDIKTLGIVLVGYGGAGHEGGNLTDAIQVVYVDFEKSTIALISIPRDLWVKQTNGKEGKINTVLASTSDKKAGLIKSGAPEFKALITQITGLPMNYLVGVDFVGFERAIGINLKGIDVEVGETLDDPWYPIKGEELNICGMSPEEMEEVHAKYTGFELERQFTCRYKHLHFEKGTVHMEGGQALEYVRSRHGSSEGDVSRGKRQQEVLKAIRKKLFSIGNISNLPGFIIEIVKNVETDFDIEIAKFLVPVLQKSQDFKTINISLATTNVLSPSNSSVNGFIMLPKEGTNKWGQVQKFIADQMTK